MNPSELSVSFHPRITDIPESTWNELTRGAGPLLSHQFLRLLEETSVASSDQGWLPNHLALSHNQQILAVMPLYLKGNSWGEFVFDFSWADAWHQMGIPYYPKLLSAIPMTPVSGPRLCAGENKPIDQYAPVAADALRQFGKEYNLSGLHILFISPEEADAWSRIGFSTRHSCSFHWFNHHYQSYEDFLARMTSRARKSLRNERAKMAQQKLHIKRITGSEACRSDWHQMHYFYQTTCVKKGHIGYMTEQMFERLGDEMREHTLIIQAWQGTELVAGALYFYDHSTLYGRYWGASREYDSLHFELCYHQGIEFCIENQLQHFDPGVQGEHKIRRGFIPILTHSAHWVSEPNMRPAIESFCEREKLAIQDYQQECWKRLPFRADLNELRTPPAYNLSE
ncbi:MAG: GNAT family N-acetyltransferase [Gammaproteobacteria bacterium]